jgi:hypothetical protein
VPVIVKQGATTERVVTKYRDRVRRHSTKATPRSSRRRSSAMSRLLLILSCLAVGSCSTTPPPLVPFPKPPIELMSPPPAVAASQAIKDVTANYGACHATELQLAALQAGCALSTR